MPVRGRGRLLALSRTLSLTRHPPAYPPDVADPRALKAFLSDTDAFHASVDECGAYVNDALERFRITMALLPPGLNGGSRILELGASPYFFTRLLRRRGLQVTCANFFGQGEEGRERVAVLHGSGGTESIAYEHFNVETEPFPYPDDAFDLVLCCEILEHLPADPVHMLAEIHRVLRTGSGTLVLTTPNAARSDGIVRLARGRNVYEPLSGHGVYGRHNRLYTVDEVRALLEAAGYEVERLLALDVHHHISDHLRLPLTASRRNRGCNLFAVAHPHGAPRRQRPPWLYSGTPPDPAAEADQPPAAGR